MTTTDVNLQEVRRRWYLHSGIPLYFMGKNFANFGKGRSANTNAIKIKKICEDYAIHFPADNFRGYHSLVLFSVSYGVGKTHLIVAISHQIIDQWLNKWASLPWSLVWSPVLFITEYDLFRRLQATYNPPRGERNEWETEGEIFAELISVPLLILDDIGKEERSDPKFVQRVLFEVIDGRYKAALPIVLTANLNPDQLAMYLGGNRGNEASFDRLVEMCGGEFFEVTGESYRRMKQQSGETG